MCAGASAESLRDDHPVFRRFPSQCSIRSANSSAIEERVDYRLGGSTVNLPHALIAADQSALARW
jgi:hypothetical protein